MYTKLGVSREHTARKCPTNSRTPIKRQIYRTELKHFLLLLWYTMVGISRYSWCKIFSHQIANFSLLTRYAEDLATIPERDDTARTKHSTLERGKHDSPVPRKRLKTVKPDVLLEGKELWNCFYRLGTEMIITKTGRSVGIARPCDKKIIPPPYWELRWMIRVYSS